MKMSTGMLREEIVKGIWRIRFGRYGRKARHNKKKELLEIKDECREKTTSSMK